MTSYTDVMRFLEYVDANLNGDKLPIKGGGGDSTEPYGTYETILDNIFEYTSFVFENNEKNKKRLADSIDELDKCRKHKEEICKEEDDRTAEEKHDEEPTSMEMNNGSTEMNNEFDEVDSEDRKYSGVLLLKGKELE
jgi:hypothetical protein